MNQRKTPFEGLDLLTTYTTQELQSNKKALVWKKKQG